MIYSRSRLITLCLLVAILARPLTSRAEAPIENHGAAEPAAPAAQVTAAPETHESVAPHATEASAEKPVEISVPAHPTEKTAPAPEPASTHEQPPSEAHAQATPIALAPVVAEAAQHVAAAAPATPEPKHESPAPAEQAHAENTAHASSTEHVAHNDIPGPDPKEIKIQIASLLKLGLSLTERSDWDAAEISFRQVLAKPQSEPDDLANALVGLARVYRRQGSLTKAAAIYERFLKDYPSNNQVPDALLELGRTHRALGAYQLAISRFYSVINSTLKVSGEGFIHYQMLTKTAQFEIAETHFQLGNFVEANKFFSRLRLLDLAPTDRARAHFKSAYSLYLDNNFEDAITTLNAFIEQWPNDENVPEARNLLALAFRTLGRKQEALDATIQLLRSQQGSADSKRWSYWQRRTGNQLANDFFQNGDTLNALAIYQGLAALAPEPVWRLPITYQIALCYERLRDSERANAAYQTIIDTNAADQTNSLPLEIKELARMSTWRVGQLKWQGETDHDLGELFNIGAVKAPPTVAGTKATPTPDHDHPGNTAKTPSSL